MSRRMAPGSRQAPPPVAEPRHCDEDTLRALARGTLAPSEAAPVRRHLQDCRECSRRLEEVDPLAGETLAPGPRGAAPEEALQRASPHALEPGGRVDRYLIVERLSSGAVGEIYAAYDPQLDRKIALKLMRADVLSAMGTRSGRASLLAEAKALARLNHPNVVAVYGVGEVGEEIFIAMELVEGESLLAWLRDRRRSPAEILPVFKMAGLGLAAAHAVGLVHRDFKPLNVLVGRDGRVRVVDFGLARAASAPEEPVPPAPGEPAASGHADRTELPLSGTPAYMAPEQLRREPADARTDQFSFAVTLFEALHGSRPFLAETPAGLLQAMERGPGPLPAKSPVPGWLHDLLVRALSFDREDRFPSMDALLEALERDPTVRRRQRWRAAGVALAAAAVVAGAVVARSSAQRECAPPGSRWAGVWDGTRRTAVREALDRTGKPFARAAADAVERAMDRYRAEWLSMHQASCLAGLDGALPGDVMALRAECLDRRLAYARALVDQLAVADGTAAQNAARAVAELQPLSDCADEQALRAGATWPLDASRRGEVEAVRAEVERASALYAVGSMTAALEVARGAAARAEVTGYLPLVADVHLLLAHLHGRLHHYEEAVAADHRAAAAAQETGQMDLVVQAWTDLVLQLSLQGEDASVWSAYAEAGLQRLSGDTRKHKVRLRREQAAMAINARQYQQGLALAREALAIAEQLPGQSPELDRALAAVATSAWYLGDLDTAVAVYERGMELVLRTEGASHPRYANYATNLAGALLERGDWEGALRHVAEAESTVRKGLSAGSSWLITLLQYRAMALAHLEVERGAAPSAESLVRSELRVLEQAGRRDEPMTISLMGTLAEVLRVHGRCGEAVPILQRVRDSFARDTAGAETEWELAELRNRLGACLLATGQPARALPELRQSVQWFEKNGTRNFLRGEGQYLLAQAQWQTGDRDGARANAAAARALLATVGSRGQKLLPEVDRWIASR